jgi:hypothetical protein
MAGAARVYETGRGAVYAANGTLALSVRPPVIDASEAR